MKTVDTKYKPTPWLIGPNTHTVWGMRFRPRSRLECKREQFDFCDGGNTVLDWFEKGDTADNAPVLVIVHTLGGGTREPCVNNMAEAVVKKGWRAVVANCRGCSGAKITSSRLYNAKEIDDLQNIINHVKESRKPKHVYLVGFSLGAMQTIEYSRVDGSVDAVACVSHTYHSIRGAEILEKPIQAKLYLPVIMEKLKASVKKCSFLNPEWKEGALKAKNLREFDDALTTKTLGLKDHVEYYKLLAIYQKIPEIKVPLLILGSDDDPFTHQTLMPIKEVEESNNVVLVRTPEGGHVSFIEGMNGQRSLVERVLPDWFEAVSKSK